MRLQETKAGGRVLTFDTPFGAGRVEWDASGAPLSNEIEIREPSPAPAAPPAKPKPCGGCGKAPTLRWLGLRWYGTPAPLRWVLPKAHPRVRGCGCVVAIKDWWVRRRGR